MNDLPAMGSKESSRPGSKPNLFIVGAPKCGTTALASYLAAHPEIFMAKKELHFFGADLKFGSQFYRRDRAAYLAEFEKSQGEKFAGEASVWYLLSKSAAQEIHAFNPDARILIMLRDPVEMLHSLYCQFHLDGNEPLPTFVQALEAEPERKAGRRLSRRTYFAQGLAYREVARFSEQVSRFFDVFGRDRVRVIIYDDFAADPALAYRQTLGFLNLDSSAPEPDFKVINPSKYVRSSFLRSLLSDPLVRSTAIATRRWLPARWFAGLQQIENWFLRSNARVQRRPVLASGLRDQLKAEVAPEIEKLSQLLGRDLTGWSRNEQGAAEGTQQTAASAPGTAPGQMRQPLDAPVLAQDSA